MDRVIRELSYLGRLIAGRLREWVRLFVLSREQSALEGRREQLLHRLGSRYHQFLLESGGDPPPAVTETVLDLRAVMQQTVHLEGLKKQVRRETDQYIDGDLGTGRPEPSRSRAPGTPVGRTTPATPLRPRPASAPADQPTSAPTGDLDLPIEWTVRRPGGAAEGEEKCECGEVPPAGARFCPACGKPRGGKPPEVSPEIAPPRKCPFCGAELPLGAEFCPECGGHIDAEIYQV